MLLLVSHSHKFPALLRAWDGSLGSSWTLSLHCLQTVKLTRHVHLRLLSVSPVSFLNQLEKKTTLKINLKCSIQSSVEYLRTFLTEAYFNTIFALDFPAYLMLKEFATGLAVWLFGCWLFFYRNSNSPRKTPAIKTTKPSNKDKIRTEKMWVGSENNVSSVCKDSRSVRGLNGKKLNCSKN